MEEEMHIDYANLTRLQAATLVTVLDMILESSNFWTKPFIFQKIKSWENCRKMQKIMYSA